VGGKPHLKLNIGPGAKSRQKCVDDAQRVNIPVPAV
jgi:hypothetical protein